MFDGEFDCEIIYLSKNLYDHLTTKHKVDHPNVIDSPSPCWCSITGMQYNRDCDSVTGNLHEVLLNTNSLYNLIIHIWSFQNLSCCLFYECTIKLDDNELSMTKYDHLQYNYYS